MHVSIKHDLERLYAGSSDSQLIRFRAELEKQLFVEDTTDCRDLQLQIDIIIKEQKRRDNVQSLV